MSANETYNAQNIFENFNKILYYMFLADLLFELHATAVRVKFY